ncbi:hypothetical protein F6X86_03495 [Enterococcus durans]|uniref:Lipoprotein n=1 Tax=Enterococcus durans TaxID=53345 RepID=A0A5N0YT88_9ENTE|nr:MULTISPECIES: hypothetical protein [Enterococcus]KAA9180243.1 hypothetical protein F6X86_03495 [Enterococcus durans]KAA9187369.1 hypothetical protein F6X85_04085 [Enterococcus durans]KAA9187538.1 hypothetical protein F6X90_04125 [Enterococcus durans]KAA9192300.1 hypothetical protein F6Y12_04430 [Enterococcus durans]KAA9194669.1 hypothetical protein F6X87_06035 [Enterococcus durans]
MFKKIFLFSAMTLTLTGCTIHSSEKENTTSSAENTNEKGKLETKKEQITVMEVDKAREEWANAVIAIGEAGKESLEKAKEKAKEVVESQYAFDEGTVLFKPTKAAQRPFRSTKAEAISYFVGGEVSEDHGFALQPWKKVRFENHDTIIDDDSAVASGEYYFSDKTGEETKAEYTFGFIKNHEGKLKINLHHSSLPYGG